MEMTLAEALLLLASVWGIYGLLEPLRRRIERRLLLLLDPKAPRVIDVTPQHRKG